MMGGKHVLPPFDLSSIFYQCITMLVHLYLSQAMSQWLLLVTDPCCDDDSLSCVFFCQSTSPGGTFYLSMYVMICARAIFRALIWLLDFCGVNQNIEIHICTWKNWKISESCTRSASLMLHLWFNVDPCGDDWGCQVSSAINIIFPALKRTQHLFC